MAALTEISGCWFFWLWLRLGKSPAWAFAGVAALVFFAVMLTRVDAAHAGRVYAAYGGIYIAASLGWLAIVEKVLPDRWDIAGAALCLAGAAVIIAAPR